MASLPTTTLYSCNISEGSRMVYKRLLHTLSDTTLIMVLRTTVCRIPVAIRILTFRHSFSAAFSYDLPNYFRAGWVIHCSVIGVLMIALLHGGFPVTLNGNEVINLRPGKNLTAA